MSGYQLRLVYAAIHPEATLSLVVYQVVPRSTASRSHKFNAIKTVFSIANTPVCSGIHSKLMLYARMHPDLLQCAQCALCYPVRLHTPTSSTYTSAPCRPVLSYASRSASRLALPSNAPAMTPPRSRPNQRARTVSPRRGRSRCPCTRLCAPQRTSYS